ncbi:MAG: hypothetical protein RIT81_15590 [Deltaproteobacteria bacterium]
MRRSALLITVVTLAGCSGTDLLNEVIDRDAGPRRDGGVNVSPFDAGSLDGGSRDGGNVTDGGARDGGAATPCGFDVLGDPDRPRVLLVGHGFTADPNTPGTQVRSMSVAADGNLVDDGVRVDVGFRPARIEFLPFGGIALVLGEDGEVASLAVDGAANVTVVDSVALEPAFFGDLRIAADGESAFAVGFDGSPTAGISTVRIACDGRLTVDTNAFFPLRLPQSLVPVGADRWVILGGQAVFDPVDDDDVRLLSVSAGGFTSVVTADIYTDAISADRIAAKHDGSTVLIPNNSGFSTETEQLAIVDVVGDTLVDRGRITGLTDPADVLWSADDQTALVALFQPGRVAVLADQGNGLTEVDRITGIGLAGQMAPIERGMLNGRVFVSSVDATGFPNIARLAIQGPGVVVSLGDFDFADGSENIPSTIAVTP